MNDDLITFPVLFVSLFEWNDCVFYLFCEPKERKKK